MLFNANQKLTRCLNLWVLSLFFTASGAGAACTYSISPTSKTHGYGSSTGTVSVTTSLGCTWTVVNTNTWITINSPTNGTNSGTVFYTVAANPDPVLRVGVVRIANLSFTLTQKAVVCAYKLSPTNRVQGAQGGSGTVAVKTSSGCAWTVTNTNGWISITSPTNGLGTGIVSYVVAANPLTLRRTGLVMVADQTFTLSQDGGACAFAINPTIANHGSGSETGLVTITTTPGCDWMVSNTNVWITFARTNGTASGTVGYAIDPNPSLNPRTGSLSIAGQLFKVVQAGAACTYKLVPRSRSHGDAASTGTVSVVTSSNVCSWTVANTNTWIAITSPTNGTGDGSVSYTVDRNSSLSARTGEVMIANQLFTIQQAGFACTYKLSPTNRIHGSGATTGTVTVTTSTNLCSWTVVNTNDWVTITSPTNQTGNGSVTYSLSANGSLSDRSGVVLIGGETFTLTQRGLACTYSISPPSRMHGHGAATNVVNVTSSTSNCAWTVSTTNDWVSILSTTNGMGNDAVTYAVDANPAARTRNGEIQIADQLFTITQAAAPCTYALAPTSPHHGSGSETGLVTLTTLDGCTWSVSNSVSWITIKSPTNGTNSGTVLYTLQANPAGTGRTGLVGIATEILTVIQAGTNCAYKLSTTNRTHGAGTTSASVAVTTGLNCAWNVINTNDWITITSSTNLVGSGSVDYTVAANPSFNARSGVIMIADQLLTLNQLGFGCAYKLTPAARTHGFGATNGTVTVTASSNVCTWTAVSGNDWITITSATNGSGNGTLSYSVSANLDPISRTGVVMVADQQLTLTQNGMTNRVALSLTVTTMNVGDPVKLTLAGGPGGPWELQRSPDLARWATIAWLTNTTGRMEFTDTVQTNSPQRFYRARTP